MNIEAVVLDGNFVRLEPLAEHHLEPLWQVGAEVELWRWTTNVINNREDMRRYVETALGERKSGVSLPFVTIEKAQNKIVGSTRFGNISRENRRVEIGWTWIAADWQRTRVNTEAKLLMLTHAFETWSCIRVELKTDVLNEKSRRAILRIGAKEEGILRRHAITDAGRIRDTVYFSIIDSEWRDAKRNLLARL